MMSNGKVLVLGATGGIGGEVARHLADTGWQVSALARRQVVGEHPAVHWLLGDAMDASAVAKAAKGCEVIVHAVNPPGYKNWAGLALPMLEHTLAAAKAQKATVLLPGTLYNYGPDSFPLIDEAAPQQPLTRKGAIRVAMEQRLRAFADEDGQAIVVRAGDFFGPRAGNNWFAQWVRPGKAVTRVVNPGSCGHQWAYLPDLAKAMVEVLVKRQQLPAFSNLHFEGHWDSDGKQMANAIADVARRHSGKTPRMVGFPWTWVPALGLFNETLRELNEMRYLWQQPVRLDNSRLRALLGAEPHTPLHQAVEESLRGLGCL
ncbi:NAD-dependent epimerase/dehydratase family protein [Gallaecimonas pentaromativorans]|uniref:NAD-dependent epimerase/dehydratase family protein n=1 Tax=Gallaecimonas pentaromativorans TaxID=584787 RepID=UPI003A917CAD